MYGRGCVGCARPARRSTAATPARSCACSPASSPARAAASSSPATSRSRAADGADRGAAADDGRAASRRRTGTRRSGSAAARCAGSRTSSGGERAGEVGDPPRRALRGGRDDGRRAGARRATTRSGCSAPGARVTRPRRERQSAGRAARAGSRSRSRATSRRRRRSSSRRRSCPARELRVHGVNLNPRVPACSTCSSGWARASPSSTAGGRGRAGRRPRGPLGGARRDDDRRRRRCRCSIDELPLFALAAACARGESVVCAAPRSCARRRATASRRPSTHCGRSGPHLRRRRRLRVRGVPARLAGRQRSLRGDHRIAMLGAVAGLVSREGVRGRGRGGRGGKLPRLLRAARPRGRPATRTDDDRRHRRARRGRQEHGRAALSPSGSASAISTRARCTARSRGSRSATASPLDDGAALGALARENPVDVRRRGPRLDRGRGRHVGDPRAEIDRIVPVVARHPAVREVMRERQRELGRRGDS